MSEAVIIGGGLAGAAAAARLAACGVAVELLEREAGPHDKICGEFLSGEAQTLLARLGVDLAPLGGAPIARVRLVSGRRSAEAPLPFVALGLSRRRLDEALLDHAAGLGAEVRRGVAVRRVQGGRVETAQGQMAPRNLLLASGKHDVRGLRRCTAATLAGHVGFKMHFRLARAARATLDGLVEITLFDGGYAGLQLVEEGIANLCLLVSDARFAALGRTWQALFDHLLEEPHLARRLADAEPLFASPLAIAAVPYGFVHRAGGGPADAVWRLGDQAAVIPSFCGDGMAMALHSGRLAGDLVADGASAGAYHARVRRDLARQVVWATRLQRLGEGASGRTAVMALAGLAPPLLTWAAAWSRVPARAIAG